MITSEKYGIHNDIDLQSFLGSQSLLDTIRQMSEDQLAYNQFEAYQWMLHRWHIINDDGSIDYIKGVIWTLHLHNYVKDKVGRLELISVGAFG